MKKLEKREKVLAAVVAVFLVAFIFEKFIYEPFSEKLQVLDIQMQTGEKDLYRLYYLDAQKENIQKTYAALEEFVEAGDANSDMSSLMMNKIESMALNCRVSLLNMKPENPRDKEDVPFEKKRVALSVEGGQRNIVKFLYRLENNKYPMKISWVDFQIKDKHENSMEADLNVEFIYFK